MAASPDETDAARLTQAYLDAIYACRSRGSSQRIRIGEAAPAIETALPGTACFGLLSAWNPGSTSLPECDNRAADARLARALRATGRPLLRSSAVAPAGDWREPGWLIAGIAPAELDTLALAFEQLGALHWHRGGAVRLRMYRPQPPGLGPHPCVDWIQCAGPSAPADVPDARLPIPGRK